MSTYVEAGQPMATEPFSAFVREHPSSAWRASLLANLGTLHRALSADEQPGYGFTGREWDDSARMYYYRGRYYDPSLGRFATADPTGLTAGINLYAYVDDRPTMMYDPSGLAAVAPEVDQKGAVRAGLQRLLDLLPNDPDCMKCLCKAGQDPIDWLKELLKTDGFGVDTIQPNTMGDVTTITHALAGGQVVGQAITVNTLGAFFNSSYNRIPLTAGGARGGTPQAQGFILLHELGHLTKALRHDKDRQDLVDQNDRDLSKNCKKLNKALRGR